MAVSETDTDRGSIASSAAPPGTSNLLHAPGRVGRHDFAPGTTLFGRQRHPVSQRGLTLYGAGMHYDPLISSRPKSLVSWGHDSVVLTLIVAFPPWARCKVLALPGAMPLYHNSKANQGEKKCEGEKGAAETRKTQARCE